MGVPVPASVLLNVVLRDVQVNDKWVLVVVLGDERRYENQGVVLNVKAVLRDGILDRGKLHYAVAPVPQLHGNLLVFRPRVVQMRIPPRVEGVLGWQFPEVPLLPIPPGLLHKPRLLRLPVDGIDRSHEVVFPRNEAVVAGRDPLSSSLPIALPWIVNAIYRQLLRENPASNLETVHGGLVEVNEFLNGVGIEQPVVARKLARCPVEVVSVLVLDCGFVSRGVSSQVNDVVLPELPRLSEFPKKVVELRL